MMSEAELLTVLKSHLGDTIKYANDDFSDYNRELEKAYRQEGYDNEDDDHSTVVASDVYDTVESDMPSFARVFLGANEIMKFIPNTKTDVEEAEQKTKYANFLIRGQRDSFKILHDLLKEPGKAQCSVAYYSTKETTKTVYKRLKGVTRLELEARMAELQKDDAVAKVDIVQEGETPDGEETFDAQIRITGKTIKKIGIETVPSESFIMTRGARDKNCTLIGHESLVTKGELVAQGYSKDLVKALTPNEKREQERAKRFENQGGFDHATGYHWTNDKVLIQTLFPLVDVDEDGVPERRMIVKCKEKILENDPFDHVPYAIFSQILEPHAAIGISRGAQAARFQLEKTAIKRGIMDNIYEAIRPRTAVDDSDGSIDGGSVDLDDLLNHEIAGVVRVDGNPYEKLMPLTVDYLGDRALQVIQYLDSEKSVTLGNQLANQGLDSDQLYKETATRFEGVEKTQQAKIELVARVYAETGFRDLYEGVIWLAQHYQDNVAEFMVLGEQMSVDPRDWQQDQYCESQVGLAAGATEENIANLSAQAMLQIQLIQQGSPITDWVKLYNTLSEISRLMGQADPGQAWNNPELPEETLFAQNTVLAGMVKQLEQQLQDSANPLLAPEVIKQQAKITEAAARLQQQGKEHEDEMDFKRRQLAAKTATDLTRLELENNQDVPGALT